MCLLFIYKNSPIKPESNINEVELVGRLKSGDTASLEYLYDRYSAALFGVVSRIIRNDEIAEEVLHDAFLKIWNRIAFYDPSKGRLFTWMLNVARNQAIDRTRSREISYRKKTDDIDPLVFKLETREKSEMSTDAIGLKEVLSKLSEEHRFVVTYLYLKGYTQSELAEEFGLPLGTVKTRMRLAMIELRKLLGII